MTDQPLPGDVVDAAVRAWMHAMGCEPTDCRCHELPERMDDDEAMRRAIEAAASYIRADERQRCAAEFARAPGDYDDVNGLWKLTRAEAAVAERERVLASPVTPGSALTVTDYADRADKDGDPDEYHGPMWTSGYWRAMADVRDLIGRQL